jgi:hypothetical protein
MNHASGKPGVPESLTIVRAVPAPAESPTPTVQAISIQKDLDRAETVLGETCRCFDMMPSMTDGGRRTCLTKDGIVLKDEISGRVMGLRRWTAIRVTRRPITIDEIKPPAELLMPQTWGIE